MTKGLSEMYSVLRYGLVETRHSARKHGFEDTTIMHAIEHAVEIIELDPDADPPKVLAIGPDVAGNLLEVVWLELDDGHQLVIHVMTLRPAFYGLLPGGENT
ncbi:MAG: hypothetical protein ACRDZ3_17235 [Acidimicrobiia bacterium]